MGEILRKICFENGVFNSLDKVIRILYLSHYCEERHSIRYYGPIFESGANKVSEVVRLKIVIKHTRERLFVKGRKRRLKLRQLG